MRTITITRKKHFAGCLIDYYCIIGMERRDFLERLKQVDRDDEENETNILDDIRYLAKIIPVKNGKSISVNTDEVENKLFIFAFTKYQASYRIRWLAF